MSNLALISDRHKIKSAPKECISVRITHVTLVRRHKIYSFLKIQIAFTFCGCTSTQEMYFLYDFLWQDFLIKVVFEHALVRSDICLKCLTNIPHQ